MKNQIIEIGVYGCDGYYTHTLLSYSGVTKAKTLLAGFHHKDVKSLKGGYLETQGVRVEESEVADTLKKYLIQQGCSEITPVTFEIGD